MRTQGYMYDEKGKYVRQVSLEKEYEQETGNEIGDIIPPMCTLIEPPWADVYKVIFNGTAWVPDPEWVEPPYVEPEPLPPTPMEILQAEVKSLKELTAEQAEVIANLKGISEASEKIAKLIEDVEAVKVSFEGYATKEELNATNVRLKSVDDMASKDFTTLQNTRYYLTLAIPTHASYFQ